MNIKYLLLFSLLFTAACTNQRAYTIIQENRRQECYKEPPPAQEECFRALDMEYGEYERQHQEILEEADKPAKS